MSRLFNRVVLLVAGTRWLPLYGVVEHVGRRSGRRFRTPVVARPTVDGFVVPMPWGEGTDWYRNVRAAGSCTLQWNGRAYDLTDLEVITDPEGVGASFNSFQRMMMRRMGIKTCLRLRHRS
jgi:deazaflavin-dependent oxidoreductase (nitroreductase family)